MLLHIFVGVISLDVVCCFVVLYFSGKCGCCLGMSVIGHGSNARCVSNGLSECDSYTILYMTVNIVSFDCTCNCKAFIAIVHESLRVTSPNKIRFGLNSVVVVKAMAVPQNATCFRNL